MKILGKIENVNSPYGKEIWKPRWKDNQRYKDNISRKGNFSDNSESVPDYYELVKEIDYVERSRISRPRTAHP